MHKRKTIDLITMIDYVNERNRLSTCDPQVRAGWNALLCAMLVKADVYGGFSFLSEGYVPAGQDPGIIRDTHGEGLHSFPDETRRRFHYHQYLVKQQVKKHIRGSREFLKIDEIDKNVEKF